jgi:hypothetical protein
MEKAHSRTGFNALDRDDCQDARYQPMGTNRVILADDLHHSTTQTEGSRPHSTRHGRARALRPLA